MLEIKLSKDSNNKLTVDPSNFEVIQKIHSESLNWELMDSIEAPANLLLQLNRGGVENHYDLSKDKYLETVVKGLNCHLQHKVSKEFNIYCNYNTTQILTNNLKDYKEEEFRKYEFNLLPPTDYFNLPTDANMVKLDSENVLLSIGLRKEIKDNCIICFSINGDNNIAEVKMKNTNKLFYWLIDPTNSLVFNFKNN